METFSKELEMVNQLFHVGFHIFARRRGNFMVICDYRTRIDAQPINALLDDLVRLTHFLHPHQIAVVTIAVGANRNIEIHLVIDFIGLFFAQVPCDARATQHRAGETQLLRTLRRDHTNTHQALLPDSVIGQQGFVFINIFWEAPGEVINKIQQ